MSTPKPTPVENKSSSTSEPWGPQQEHLKTIFGEAGRLYNDPSKPQFYPGPTFADPSQSTLQGLAGTEARAQYGSPTLAAAQGEATKSLNGDYLSAGNPHFSQMAGRISSEVLPRISGGFANAGGAGGLQARAASLGLGDAIGSLAYQNYGDERNRMGQYAGMAPQLAAADYLDPQMMMQAGAQREQIAQKPIDEAMGRFNFEQNLPQAKLADYMQMVQGNFGGTSNTTGTQYVQQQNPWMQALGLGIGGLSAAGRIFSDARLKENVERVGATDDGIPLYKYNYLGDEMPRIGPMAQEVLEHKPQAVGVAPMFGKPFLTVDMGAL